MRRSTQSSSFWPESNPLPWSAFSQANLDKVNRFFLLISPPQAVIEYAFYLKRLIQNTIGHAYDGAYSIAHISLHQYPDFHNESLLYSYREKIARIKPFNIHIKDFSLFKNNGTICLDVVNKFDIEDLAEQVFNKHITPHMTLAANLNAEESDIVWRLLKNFSFSCAFKCDHVTTLRSISGRWNNHLDFPLKGMPLRSKLNLY
jgi:2'-5' RNA ligase